MPDWRRERGLCLLNGRHTPDSDWERECPLLRIQREAAATSSERPAAAAGEFSETR